jgi:spermidine synthase
MVYRALKPGGITCSQCECVWLHLPLIKSMADMCRSVFANVQVCVREREREREKGGKGGGVERERESERV